MHKKWSSYLPTSSVRNISKILWWACLPRTNLSARLFFDKQCYISLLKTTQTKIRMVLVYRKCFEKWENILWIFSLVFFLIMIIFILDYLGGGSTRLMINNTWVKIMGRIFLNIVRYCLFCSFLVFFSQKLFTKLVLVGNEVGTDRSIREMLCERVAILPIPDRILMHILGI